MVAAAGVNAGLDLVEECAALIAGIRGGRLVPRGSFFQQRNVRAAVEDGDPQWLLQHEDVVIFRAHPTSAGSHEPTCSAPQPERPRPSTFHVEHRVGGGSEGRVGSTGAR
jgi:hypothetical protein